MFCCVSLNAVACTNIFLRTQGDDVSRARTMELAGDLESETLVIPKGTAKEGYGPAGEPTGPKWATTYSTAGLNGDHLPIIVDGLNPQGLTGGTLMNPTFVEYAPLGSGESLHGIPGDFTPPTRFVRATIYSQVAPKLDTAEDTVLEAFHIMNQNQFDTPPGVAPGNPATTPAGETPPQELMLWTIVVDRANLTIYVTTREDRSVQVFDLSSIDE
ncbi:MAG: linear amide C-N hydrolase, partial [Chloroflexia bacterium]|nr:linear amide C-N hydrolase [Chloroflexia bacterium]